MTKQKKTAILLSSCGIETCRVFKGLTAPNLPGSKAFNDLVKSMEDHENPRRNPVAERFKFNMRNRKADESVSAYVAELRRLSQYCEYGNSLDSMLRDRLVCGINHDRTQQRLLSEGATLTLQKALDISLSLESAIQQSAIIHNDLRPKQEVVANVEKKPNSTSKCYRCDGQLSAKVCPFIEKQCFYCKNKGHTLKVCRKKVKRDSLKRLTEENNDHEEDEAIYSMYNLSS